MLRVPVSLASLALLLTACGSDPKAVYEQENFTENQTYSRSYPADYQVACDAGRRALLSQGYAIDKMAGDMITGHKNFLDATGRNTQITFNVNCAPDNTGPNHAQVFANAVQDSFSLKKSSTAASVGVGILGSVSLPFSSTDDALVKTSSLTVTRPQFYGGFFDLLQQYLAVSQLEHPAASETPAPRKRPAAPAPAPAPAVVTPTVPLTPENTGIAKPPVEPAQAEPATTETAPPAAPAAAPTSTPSTPAAPAAESAPAKPAEAPPAEKPAQ